MTLSVRTEIPGEDASRLIRATLDGMGSGGGHRRRAGGKIPGGGRRASLTTAYRDELVNRWLAACGERVRTGRRLVARHEIIKHLYPKDSRQ
jgi:hypothetical protein